MDNEFEQGFEDNETIETTQLKKEEKVISDDPFLPGLKLDDKPKKKDSPALLIIAIILVVVITIIMIISINKYSKNKAEDNKVVANTIVFGDEISLTGTGTEKKDGVVTISKAGTYIVSGATVDGSILVNAPAKDVILVLNNLNLRCSNDAAIKVLSANLVTVNLKKDTKNFVEDGGNVDDDAAIFSNSNIIIKGDGDLTIQGNVKDGITSTSSDITIESGNINIYATENGLNAGGNSGTIAINGGSIYIEAEKTGIYSSKDLVINGGTLYVISAISSDSAAIYSENPYKINGGIVVALGNMMTNNVSSKGKQKAILFDLDTSLSSEIAVSLTDNSSKEIISFLLSKKIKTITISTPKLIDGIYNLYSGVKHEGKTNNKIYTSGELTLGSKVSIQETSEFTVSSTVNWFGKTDQTDSSTNTDTNIATDTDTNTSATKKS